LYYNLYHHIGAAFSATNTVSMDCCSCSCASLVEKIALLERRICQLEEEKSAPIEKADTPEKVERGPPGGLIVLALAIA